MSCYLNALNMTCTAFDHMRGEKKKVVLVLVKAGVSEQSRTNGQGAFMRVKPR